MFKFFQVLKTICLYYQNMMTTNISNYMELQLCHRELLETKTLTEYLTFCKTQILGCNRKETKSSGKGVQ